MAKEKEKDPTFNGTIAYSKSPVVGVPLYRDQKADQSLDELLDELEKGEVRTARKDIVLNKLKEKFKGSEPNPKRYSVDPETGRIDIDEEGGEYTQRDAMLVSASIKGKSGQYDAAINLITAAKELVAGNQSTGGERPKEFLVDPETGVITRDPEIGEYTLSEARTISQSLQKGKQTLPDQGPKSFLEKLDEITQGMVSQKLSAMLGGNEQHSSADPLDVFIHSLDQADKLRERFAPSNGGIMAQSGMRDGLVKILLEDDREKLKIQKDYEVQVERNKHLGELTSVVKENLSDGIRALTMAAEEARGQGGTAKQGEDLQTCECPNCRAKFTVPKSALAGDIGCPKCHTILHSEEAKSG